MFRDCCISWVTLLRYFRCAHTYVLRYIFPRRGSSSSPGNTCANNLFLRVFVLGSFYVHRGICKFNGDVLGGSIY